MSKFRDFDNYEVYEDGRIWSYKSNKWLKPVADKDGYQMVCLYDNKGKGKNYKVHRVVWEAVTGSPIPNNFQCNHISEDKMDNRFCNINLMTPKQNSNWGSRNSRISKANTNNPKRSKQVGAFKNNELIMIFPSAGEAGRNGFDKKHISDCCNGKSKTHKGYTWRYINEKRD